MIHSIKFNKKYFVEPLLFTNNPLAINKSYKLNKIDRSWQKEGENI